MQDFLEEVTRELIPEEGAATRQARAVSTPAWIYAAPVVYDVRCARGPDNTM